jgi:glutathione S-transferase
MSLPYHVYGVDNSFYTHKVLGGLKGLGVPHTFLYKSLAVRQHVEERSGYTRMPVVETPEGDWLTDSTPILLQLSAARPDRALMPTDRVLAVVARILDDWLDEWLIRPAVWWRANVPTDRAVVAEVAARNLMGLHRDQPLIDEQEAKMRRMAEKLQGFFAGVGSVNRATADHEAEVLDLFSRSFDLLSAHLARHAFLLGSRVSLPDYALYGALQGHFLLDPSPAALIAERWPGLLDYHARVTAAEAGSGDWIDADRLPAGLKGLLRFIAEDFHAFLAANRVAVESGAPEAVWDGMSMTARPYTERCRAEIAVLVEMLPPDERARATASLGPLGVLRVFGS